MGDLDVTVSAAVPTEPKKRARRGFSAMEKSKQMAIASSGGRASHNPPPGKKRGHEWDSVTASEAGRKGGLVSRGGRGRLVTPETK